MDQPRIYLSSPHMGESEFELVREAFATNWIAPLGPHVDAFEREFAELIGRKKAQETQKSGSAEILQVSGQVGEKLHAAALSSGTAALHLAMRLVGVRRDDEVLVSTLTFSASVNPILYEGGRPVFIDSERTSWNLDPNLLDEALTARAKAGKRPKAVVLVHLYGQCADLDTIEEICHRHEVPLIEDAAEALGATYYGGRRTDGGGRTADDGRQRAEGGGLTEDGGRRAEGVSPGTRGRIGIYSFNGNKIITTSGGGMLVSADAALVDKARFMATQSRDPAPHYQHSELGYNYRLSNVLAGIGRGQLRVLADRVNARRANTEFYQRALGGLPGLAFMPEAPWGRSTRWLTCVTIDPAAAGTDREQVRLALAAENIEARPVWKPMHLQPVFAGYERCGGEVAEDLFNRGLCLPSGSNLTQAELERVAEAVRRCWRR
jgi:pyridoxal phosphate-dependent aminotransferase EpsN